MWRPPTVRSVPLSSQGLLCTSTWSFGSSTLLGSGVCILESLQRGRPRTNKLTKNDSKVSTLTFSIEQEYQLYTLCDSSETIRDRLRSWVLSTLITLTPTKFSYVKLHQTTCRYVWISLYNYNFVTLTLLTRLNYQLV